MHMADALISPAVGGTMWAASAGLIGYCSKKIKDDRDDATIPLTGVVGAFIFAAQMINFTIPGTGFQRTSRWWNDPGYIAWPLCRFSDDGLRAGCSSTVFR